MNGIGVRKDIRYVSIDGMVEKKPAAWSGINELRDRRGQGRREQRRAFRCENANCVGETTLPLVAGFLKCNNCKRFFCFQCCRNDDVDNNNNNKTKIVKEDNNNDNNDNDDNDENDNNNNNDSVICHLSICSNCLVRKYFCESFFVFF